MNCFRWWRRWRGGRWMRSPGYLWGWRWIRLKPEDFLWDDYTEDWGGSVGYLN
ncbi:MAG: hypothetical protein WCC87_10360 [Candidatus Korobacteraceae bacterium]